MPLADHAPAALRGVATAASWFVIIACLWVADKNRRPNAFAVLVWLAALSALAAAMFVGEAATSPDDDEALMLDPHGFVATCNSTNFFVVRRGEVWAPTTKYQLHGITRQNVLNLCRQHGIPCRELDFSLTQVYSADEAFVTGTFAGQIPVTEVDGRVIGSELIGQPFSDPKYFWGRLSATAPMPYNAAASAGSNFGPSNPALTDAARARIDARRATARCAAGRRSVGTSAPTQCSPGTFSTQRNGKAV